MRNVLHASCVCVGMRGLLIRGAAGSGKSSLALELISRGARLVADDRVIVFRSGEGRVVARAPTALGGRIEARGLGILAAPAAKSARLVAIVDLDHPETCRLPESRVFRLLDVDLPLFYRVEGPQFAPGLHLFLRSGYREV